MLGLVHKEEPLELLYHIFSFCNLPTNAIKALKENLHNACYGYV